MDSSDRSVYLTFDDGPHPEATPFVLNTLREEGIKATFFLLGKNAEAYPELVQLIGSEGHAIGNHGYAHLNGWRTSAKDHLADFAKAESLLGNRLYRPAYGKLTIAQYSALSSRTTIALWDVLSGDFDTTITGQQCEANVLNGIRNGSIIVMHESTKSFPNMSSSLKSTIKAIKVRGYQFKKL